MTSMDDLIAGFTILRRYDASSAREINTDHDLLWAGPQDREYAEYTQQDRDQLEELGWHFDEEITRWANYT